MRREEEDAELVYSTEVGDLRKGEGKRSTGNKGGNKKRRKGSAATPPPEAGGGSGVKVRREKKGRGGKTVTAVYGLDLSEDSLKELGKKIKQSCGTGGSVKDGVIEIQGDMVDAVIGQLEKEGYTAKKAGG